MEILPSYTVLVARRPVARNDHNNWVGLTTERAKGDP